jgi:hypothetical protein
LAAAIQNGFIFFVGLAAVAFATGLAEAFLLDALFLSAGFLGILNSDGGSSGSRLDQGKQIARPPSEPSFADFDCGRKLPAPMLPAERRYRDAHECGGLVGA